MTNHWWQVMLCVNARGLTSEPIPYGARDFEVEFDLVDHHTGAIRVSDGTSRAFPLATGTVAQFYEQYFAALELLGIHVRINPRAVEMPEEDPSGDSRSNRPRIRSCLGQPLRLRRGAVADRRHFQAVPRGVRSTRSPSPVPFLLEQLRPGGDALLRPPRAAAPGGVPNCPDYVSHEGVLPAK